MINNEFKTTSTQVKVVQIASKATFLFERLINNNLSLNVTHFNEKEADKRIVDWCKVIAKGDLEVFHKRLEWSNWNIETIRDLFGTEPIFDSQNLPNWVKTLSDIIHILSESNIQKISPNASEPENPYPFEEILLALVAVARQKLLNCLGFDSLSPDTLPLKILSEAAYLNLEKALLQKLFNLSAKALEFEFSISRSFGKNFLSQFIKNTKNVHSTELYKTFIQKSLADGLLGFFQKYPLLARFIVTTIDFWVEATKEFLERLDADLGEIQQKIHPLANTENYQAFDTVIEIKSAISDSHNQNRSVIALTFASGRKLVYKPKNLGLEVAFCQFLEWCNQELTLGQNHPSLNLKVLQVINRGDYGWVEYIEQKPCEDEAAAQRFYIRAGMLLCLLYVLGGTDCHNENLIACGENLVLVDMETVMQHEAKLMGVSLDQSATSLATNQLFDSVLRTGLLPMWEFAANDSIACDFSGLGSVEVQPVPIPMPVWKFINTDDMHQGYEKLDRPLEANIALLNGMPLSPKNYINELVIGFEQMYCFLMRQKEVLLAANSPLNVFHAQKVRFIFRPTRVYGMLLGQVMTPEFLQHGLDWSIQVDVLSRSFLTNGDKPLAWQILLEELKAISQLDIPYFSGLVDGDTLPLGEEKAIVEYFKTSCLSQVRSRLQKLNENDLAQQLSIIQLAFYAKEARILQTNPSSSISQEAEYDSALVLTSAELLEQAQEIASEIQNRAICGADDSLTWISLTYVLSAERFQLMPLGYSFYDGNCGIAVFLAALARVTGKTLYRDLALRAIQPLQNYLQTSDTKTDLDTALNLGIGGATGLGSIIYSFVKISQFLEVPQLCADVQRFANLITPTAISADRKFDIIGGAAGAILGLLALAQEQPMVLKQAIACGQHLLKYCNEVFGKTSNLKGLIGFSHGAAGIAYALLRLYAVTQDTDYLDAARMAIAYENALFYPSVGNWREITPVYDPASLPVFWSTWCHGAPGIALGRLGSLSIDRSEQILTDIEVALKTTQNTALQTIDHLCCGNLGRCEVMLVAAQKLHNPDWYQAAQQLAAIAVARATRKGRYELFGDLPNFVYNPSLFQGAAGIGYQLLRLAYPEELPSVLLWE